MNAFSSKQRLPLFIKKSTPSQILRNILGSSSLKGISSLSSDRTTTIIILDGVLLCRTHLVPNSSPAELSPLYLGDPSQPGNRC